MVKFNIELAGVTIQVNALFDKTKCFCHQYLTDKQYDFSVSVLQEDIDCERELSKKQGIAQGIPIINYPDDYLETNALYRKIVTQLLNYNVLLMHGAVVAVDDEAFLFTAESGTGKSTHAKLWLKNIKGSYILNGDKPLLLFKDKKVYACATPWQGKENLGVNKILPLKAICILERAQENNIHQISYEDAFPTLVRQIYHPNGTQNVIRTVSLIKNLGTIGLYKLECNMNDEAALVSYNAIASKKTTFEDVLKKNGQFCFKNVGVSMLPMLREGKDIMIIEQRPKTALKKYDVVLFIRPEITGRGEYILHRILKVNKDSTYFIAGDNCSEGETVADENIIGLLKAVIRDGKTVSVNSKKYKLYVHLWCDLYPVRFLIIKANKKIKSIKTKTITALYKRYLKMRGRL